MPPRRTDAPTVYRDPRMSPIPVRINIWLFQTYLHIECYFLHDVHTLRKCFGHLLHTVEILHWLLYISVLFQQLELPCIMYRNLDLWPNDVVPLLQAMGSDGGPLAAGVNQKVVIFPQPFYAFP